MQDYKKMLTDVQASLQACTDYLGTCDRSLDSKADTKEDYEVLLKNDLMLLTNAVNQLQANMLSVNIFANEAAEEAFNVVLTGSLARCRGIEADYKPLTILQDVLNGVAQQLKTAVLTKEKVEISTYL